jgi:hypothetical protein
MTELERDIFMTGFRERQQAPGRISAATWADLLTFGLELVLIVEVIWTAGKVGDLVVLALQLAGTGWI